MDFLDGLGAAGAALLTALALVVAPEPDQFIAPWAESGAIVIPAEANTSRPGPLSFDEFEYCLEPLENLHYDTAIARVPVMAAGQTGKSNIGVTFVGWTIAKRPRPVGLALPSGPKAASFNSKKLQPVIDKSPGLVGLVVPENSRASRGSTTRQKNYPGGSLTLFSVGSVNDLQSESFGAIWITESPNFPAEVGSRGSPMTQVRVRMDGWEAVGTKELHESTPGEEDSCPIFADYQAGDQRKVYLPCPHCDRAFRIEWEDFSASFTEGDHEPYVQLPCCGQALREPELKGLKAKIRTRLYLELAGEPVPAGLEAGYLPTFPSRDAANSAPGAHVAKADFDRWRARPDEGRGPSYHFWQILSPLKTWRGLAKDWRDSVGKPTEEAAFRQQKLGLPTETAAKAPDHLSLLSASQKLGRRRGEIPPGMCWLTGTADIQGDRIEWAVQAHGPANRARIDRGVIELDPLGVEAWVELAKVLARRYEGDHTRPLGIDAFGVDSGGVEGVTPRVYEFVRGRANCYAIKGASRPLDLPTEFKRIKGKDTRGRTITVERLLVDGYVFKRFTAYALRLLVQGADQAEPVLLPGAVSFEDDATEADFLQLTAEVLKRPVGAKPLQRGVWDQLPNRPNEQLDLDVYAQALAYQKGLPRWEAARWEAEFAARAKVQATPEAPPLLALIEQPARPRAELPENPGGSGRDWFNGRKKL